MIDIFETDEANYLGKLIHHWKKAYGENQKLNKCINCFSENMKIKLSPSKKSSITKKLKYNSEKFLYLFIFQIFRERLGRINLKEMNFKSQKRIRLFDKKKLLQLSLLR